MSTDLLGEARRRLDAGDPSSALRLAERAHESARTTGSPKALAAAAHLVGECRYVTGDIRGAQRSLNETLEVTRELDDPEALGADLNLWGVLEIAAGHNEDAIGLLQQSYDLRAEALGPDDPDTIESLNNLAAAYWRVGAEDRAIELHEAALGRCERALGEDHRRTAETLNALAVKLESPRGRELSERGLRAAEAALGPDSELAARLLTNVATARINDGDAESAEPHLERALELHERHFGVSSRWTAHVLLAQGGCAQQLGRLDDARRAYARALVIFVREAGATSPEAVDATLGLIGVLNSTSSDEDRELAMALYMALVGLNPELGSSFPGGASPDPVQAEESLQHLVARFASEAEPDPEAEETLARAGELTEHADGSFLSGDVEAAAAQLREALALIESARGPSDTALVEPLKRLGMVVRFAGRESEYLPLLRRIASIYADAYGETHPVAIRALAEVFHQERREYGPGGGRETAARIESLTRDALGETSALGAFVRNVFAFARDTAEDAEPWNPPLSARRERFLAEPGPLATELLADLDEVRWASLEHAYGPAVDTPLQIRLLLADDELVRRDALDALGQALLHQGSRYPATEPALSFVRRLADDERVPDRGSLADLLAAAGR